MLIYIEKLIEDIKKLEEKSILMMEDNRTHSGFVDIREYYHYDGRVEACHIILDMINTLVNE